MKLNEIKDVSGENITRSQIRGDHKKLAKRLGIKPENLKDMSDSEIEAIIKNVGKHDFVPDDHFSKSALRKGTAIEYEHTNSKLVATLIAKDHLIEDPKYYDKLEKIEKKPK